MRSTTLVELLRSLDTDVDAGLIGSVADEASALAFEDFLEHAADFLARGQIQMSGVIAGVAFEDVMRKVRAQQGIEPAEIALESLISELEKRGYFIKNDGRHARTAAALRTSATHARWEEFNAHNVDACIRFTRTIVERIAPRP